LMMQTPEDGKTASKGHVAVGAGADTGGGPAPIGRRKQRSTAKVRS
jgi:hypothetical protein